MTTLGSRQADVLKALFLREAPPRYLSPTPYAKVVDSLVKLGFVERQGNSAAVRITESGARAVQAHVRNEAGTVAVTYRTESDPFTSLSGTRKATDRSGVAKDIAALRADGVTDIWVESNGVRQTPKEYYADIERLDCTWDLGLSPVLHTVRTSDYPKEA